MLEKGKGYRVKKKIAVHGSNVGQSEIQFISVTLNSWIYFYYASGINVSNIGLCFPLCTQICASVWSTDDV